MTFNKSLIDAKANLQAEIDAARARFFVENGKTTEVPPGTRRPDKYSDFTLPGTPIRTQNKVKK